MCYNCGCANVLSDMGNPHNITESTFDTLAKKLNKSVADTKKFVASLIINKDKNPEIEEMFANAAKAWGQSIDEAKSETLKLLKDEGFV